MPVRLAVLCLRWPAQACPRPWWPLAQVPRCPGTYHSTVLSLWCLCPPNHKYHTQALRKDLTLSPPPLVASTSLTSRLDPSAFLFHPVHTHSLRESSFLPFFCCFLKDLLPESDKLHYPRHVPFRTSLIATGPPNLPPTNDQPQPPPPPKSTTLVAYSRFHYQRST